MAVEAEAMVFAKQSLLCHKTCPGAPNSLPSSLLIGEHSGMQTYFTPRKLRNGT